VETDNPWDTVVLAQSRVLDLVDGVQGEGSTRQAREIVEQLERYRYIQPGAACQVLAGAGPLDPPTLSIELSMVLLAATVPDSFLEDAEPAALAIKIGEGVQLFQKHATLAYNLLSEVCCAELDGYPTSVSDDVVLLEQLDLQATADMDVASSTRLRRHRLAVAYRLGKKRLLAALG